MNTPRDGGGAASEPLAIRDLSDLCTQWPDLREELCAALDAGALEPRPDAIARWLVKLADNVCTFGDVPP